MLPDPALANNDTVFDRVRVTLLPEYGQPSVLVTYEIDLAPETPLPKELIFQIPMAAQLRTVASLDDAQDLTPLETDVNLSGAWQEARFTTPTHALRLEYHDPALVRRDDLRSFDYDWRSRYAVEKFSIAVQQPFGASELISDPKLTRIEEDPSAPVFYAGEFGTLESGEMFSLSLRYTRNPENPSYPVLNVSPAAPIDANTRGRTASPLSVVMWLLAVAVAVVIFVGLLYFWASAHTLEKRDEALQGLNMMSADKESVFCHECGMRSKTGDSYCRNCGTDLRKFG